MTLVLWWVTVGSVFAMEPIETIKGPLEESLALLNDPRYKDPTLKDEQRDKIWTLIESVFDFEEVSKRALARNWRRLNPGQQKEFIELFTQLLGNTYLDQVQMAYKDETVSFDSQEIHDSKPLARVKARIISAKGDIPVDYSLKNIDGGWRVYDVRVEGISLIKNYRTQFDEILMKESPEALIDRLREKVDEQKTELSKG
jgi:phospholipid transport system substrate-binding protein